MTKKKEGLFEKVEAEIIKETGTYFKNRVRKTLIKWGEISILLLLGMFMISIGIAEFIGDSFPAIANGVNYLIVGIIFLIVGFLLKQ